MEDEDSEGELAAGTESQAEDAGSDEPEAKRRQHFPASMGLSVFLPPAQGSGPDHVEVEVRWADYERIELAEDRSDKVRVGWKRVARGPYTVQVPLDPKKLSAPAGVRWPESTQLCFRGELRTTDLDGLPAGTRVLSLFLLNDRVALEKDRDLNFAFQVTFTLRYARGFVARPNRRGEGAMDQDPRVLALMFRDRAEWAVGHNTSVKVPSPGADGLVRELSTTQLPCYEVRGVEHESVKGIETGMLQLCELDSEGLRRSLTPLVDTYRQWIDKQRYTSLDRTDLEKTREDIAETKGGPRLYRLRLLRTGRPERPEGRGADLYDVVQLVDNYASAIDLDRARDIFHDKCTGKGIAIPTSADLVALVRDSEDLAADWTNMLANQLPALPPLEAIRLRLGTILAWVDEPETEPPVDALHPVTTAPEIPRSLLEIAARAGEEIVAPAGVTFWRTAPLELVRFAGANRLMVEFDYNGKHRKAEPYSLRRAGTGNLLLYARERDVDHVKAFKVDEISRLAVSNTTFDPRYPIDLNAISFVGSGKTAERTRVSRPFRVPRPAHGPT